VVVPLLVGVLIGILFSMGVSALFSSPDGASEGGEKSKALAIVREVDLSGLVTNMNALHGAQESTNVVSSVLFEKLEAMAERQEELVEEVARLSGLIDEALGEEDEDEEEEKEFLA